MNHGKRTSFTIGRRSTHFGRRVIVCKDGYISWPLGCPRGIFRKSAPLMIEASNYSMDNVENVVGGHISSLEQWELALVIGVKGGWCFMHPYILLLVIIDVFCEFAMRILDAICDVLV